MACLGACRGLPSGERYASCCDFQMAVKKGKCSIEGCNGIIRTGLQGARAAALLAQLRVKAREWGGKI